MRKPIVDEVALTDAPHAEDGAEPAGGSVGLVRVGDDARVADRGRLHGVLMGERGPQQQPALLAQLGVGVDAVGDPVGVVAEGADEVAVAAAEADEQLGHPILDLVLAEREEATDHVRGAALAPAHDLLAGDEQAGDDPEASGRRWTSWRGGDRPCRHRGRRHPTGCARRRDLLARGEQRERRLGALVEVGSVGAEAVVATSGEVPHHGPVSLSPSNQAPAIRTPSVQRVSFVRLAGPGAGVGHGGHLDRLLVEPGTVVRRTGAAGGRDGQVAVDRLAVEEPAEQLEPAVDELRALERVPGGHQGVGEGALA